MRNKTTPLFSYRTEAAAARTLRVLRGRHGVETTFALVPREDWRLYIRATRRCDGASGYVAKRPLRDITASA